MTMVGARSDLRIGLVVVGQYLKLLIAALWGSLVGAGEADAGIDDRVFPAAAEMIGVLERLALHGLH